MDKKSMDYSNPYDYANPVVDVSSFADRDGEILEILELLELTEAEDPTYFNLAITGPRASGKTSLLNILQSVVDEKEFLPVKIDLNNHLVNSDAEFFKEILDEIIEEGVRRGMYGGKSGRVYRKYKKLINTLEFEITFDVPFNFGGAYIGSKKDGGVDRIKQRDIQDDLNELYTEAQDNDLGTIVIFLDECDLLSKNQALLQKLRNIFQEVDGYMLVVSGTEEMFENLEETFSPIPRSFKKVRVENFNDVHDTAECILKPLSKDERKLVDDKTISDIHNISNGSPHEINLIMHQVYKYYKRDEQEELTLSTQVLESVLDEIDRLREDDRDKTIQNVKSLSIIEMKVLASLFEISGLDTENLTKYSILNEIELLSHNSASDLIQENNRVIDSLEEGGFIKVKENEVLWDIDDFDKLFLKYYILSNTENYILTEDVSPNSQVSRVGSKIIRVLADDFSNVKSTVSLVPGDGSSTASQMPTLAPGESVVETSKENIERFTIRLPNEYDAENLDFPKEIEEKMDKEILEDVKDTAKELVSGDDISEESANQLRFSSRISWRNKSITNTVEFKDKQSKDMFKEEMKRIKDELSDAGINLYIEDLVSLREKGWNQINGEDWRGAKETFECAEEIAPDDLGLLHGKAVALFELNRNENALNIVDDLLEEAPKLEPVLFLKALILEEENEITDALNVASKLVNENPSSPANWNLITGILSKTEETREKLIHRLIESDLQMAEIDWIDDEVAFKSLMLLKIAEFELFKEYIEDTEIGVFDLSVDYINKYEMGRQEKNEFIKTLRGINPDTEREALHKAVCMLDLGNEEDAINILREIDDSKKQDKNLQALIKYNLSCALARNDDADWAEHLEKAIELDEEYKETAKTDPDFDKVENSKKFNSLVKE